MLYSLNHSVKEFEGKVIHIDMYHDTYHDTMQKYRYIMIRFLCIDTQPYKQLSEDSYVAAPAMTQDLCFLIFGKPMILIPKWAWQL
jgi:hypothetical protein